MPEEQKTIIDRFLRPILASRFLTISALIHLLLVVLFGGKVLFNKYVEPPDFQAPGGDFVETGDNTPAPPPPSPADTLPAAPSVNTAPPPPSVAAPAAALSALSSLSTNASFTLPVPTVAAPSLSQDIPTQSAPAQPFGAKGLPGLPSSMGGRGGNGRGAAAQQYGQKNTSEEAVIRALQWLQAHQHSDGMWGDRYKGAMTGLAVLCYLGHGETPDTSKDFGLVVTNAINALIAEGTKNGGRFSFTKEFAGNEAVYQHAICTYALCEAYTMTKNDKLPPIIAQAVGYILDGQTQKGGWMYGYVPNIKGESIDTSVTGWQVQALHAARLTGLPGMERIPPALDNAIKAMDSLFNRKDGAYGYRKVGDRNYTLTGVGVLAKLFLQGRADQMVREGLKNIMSIDLNYSAPQANLYAWYYDTQACFQAQGGAWDWWNKRFQDQLVGKQLSDGSWPPSGAGAHESGRVNGADEQSNVYRVTLCTLMLEVFYRYLPTTKENGGGQVEGL